MGVVIARDVLILPTPGYASLTRGYKMYHPAGVIYMPPIPLIRLIR